MDQKEQMLIPVADLKLPAVMALIPGGAAALPNIPSQQFAVDSNVVIKLGQIREGKVVDRGAELRAWLESTAVDKATFNPLPFAFESARQRPPTLAEFKEGFERGVTELRHALPGYAVVEYEANSYQKVFEVLQKVSRTFEDDMTFLMRVCPELWNRKGAGKERALEREIFSVAKACRISRNSPLVLAALSCLYADVHGMHVAAGAGVLKPAQKYSETDAYNALSDLRHLHMAAVSNHMLQPPVVFCTCDHPLLEFWVATKPHVRDTDGKASIAFDPMHILFHRLDAEGVSRLMERINAGHD